jgi:large conductance mechanosensitive channel
MGLMDEFKAFALKGNMVDLAVGVIIGGAFGKIVNSLVADVIMPPIGLLTGGMDFSNLKYILNEASTKADGTAIEAVSMNYGLFIQQAVDFLIVAFCVFMLIKAMNTLKKQQAEAPAAPPAEEVLLTEIRDLLKTRG